MAKRTSALCLLVVFLFSSAVCSDDTQRVREIFSSLPDMHISEIHFRDFYSLKSNEENYNLYRKYISGNSSKIRKKTYKGPLPLDIRDMEDYSYSARIEYDRAIYKQVIKTKGGKKFWETDKRQEFEEKHKDIGHDINIRKNLGNNKTEITTVCTLAQYIYVYHFSDITPFLKKALASGAMSKSSEVYAEKPIYTISGPNVYFEKAKYYAWINDNQDLLVARDKEVLIKMIKAAMGIEMSFLDSADGKLLLGVSEYMGPKWSLIMFFPQRRIALEYMDEGKEKEQELERDEVYPKWTLMNSDFDGVIKSTQVTVFVDDNRARANYQGTDGIRWARNEGPKRKVSKKPGKEESRLEGNLIVRTKELDEEFIQRRIAHLRRLKEVGNWRSSMTFSFDSK